VRKPRTPFGHLQVNAGIGDFIVVRAARPNLQVSRIFPRAVLQMVAIRSPCLETGTVAGAEDFFTRIGDQNELAFHHINEFIFGAMPMPLTRPGAGGKPRQVHAKVGETRGVSEATAEPADTGLVVGRRVARAGDGLR